MIFRAAFAVSAALAIVGTAALAAPCGTGSFQAWLDDFKTEAAAKGISQAAITSGLNGVTLDQGGAVAGSLAKGFQPDFRRVLRPHGAAAPHARLQHDEAVWFGARPGSSRAYGVPGEVLVAIWGLETDFGVNIGKFPTIRSLATLAYDCRRSEMFRGELMDALRIVERGDLAPSEMRGAWAGEIGQTQFMPSSYIKFAVDFDGNGRRDLLRSAPDVLASTANFLASYGWQRGKDWEPGSAEFRGPPAVEQERGLRQDHWLFRHPARPHAVESPAS